ncbi:hypothetical protein [Phaeacidiphilus oryzae]|uniref:hypothetical protein n=1 Tax=Phaeacidiphilus oryzae TaxID=348818 RepID=UPI00055D1992|nr:hypothetical protein [Phaeacidiphilus oryzae]
MFGRHTYDPTDEEWDNDCRRWEQIEQIRELDNLPDRFHSVVKGALNTEERQSRRGKYPPKGHSYPSKSR